MNERDLFLSALEIEDPAARKAHLQASCAGNLELLSRVESLLASHETASRFLRTPVVEQRGDEAAATIVVGTGSTDEEVASQSQERAKMDEEIPLGYLEPSTKAGSLGRLAHYEILEVVGQGAFGTVLRAFDEKLQRVVAIKVMAPELAATSPARKRFVREAQASGQIRHENVVSVYAVEERPIPHLVMEYIPGVTLQQRLDERGPLDVPTVLRLGAQIAEGLAAAHAKDLIHRDIKPGNILLETGMRDRVKITDFGLARAADDASMTQSGVIAGTPMYMAPEQALGQKLDQRADLFSFGSVLYQMVSGRPPFRAPSTLAVLKRLTEETPRPIQEIIPETPRWLCDIITKLHAKNPDERFQTAKEVAELLEQHSAHLQNPSQVVRPAAVTLPPAAEKPMPAKPGTGPEMRPLMVPQGIRWPLLIATGIMFLLAVLLLVVTESTGVTQLFSGWDMAQVTSPPIPPEPDPLADEFRNIPWMQLFNGKDLEGWVKNPDFPGNWRVEDGNLVGSGPDQIGLLQTARKDIGDFHLRAEVLINSQAADGGIFFRSLPQASNELNLCFDPNLPTQQTGSLVIHKPDTKDSTWHSAPAGLAQANAWTTVEIIARGGYAVTKVNGKTAAKSQALCGNPHGHIMLQHLGPQTVVRFRKIEIKELPPKDSQSTPPLAVAPFDVAQAKAHQDAWAKHLGLPLEYTNSIGMKLRLIPPGKNTQGTSDSGESTIALYAGATEVTVDQFRQFVHDKEYQTTGEANKLGGMRVRAGAKTERDPEYIWSNPDFTRGGDHPVSLVTWHDAMAFCDWLSRKEGRTYRLPTSAEWRWLERAGSAERFYCGAAGMDGHAWHHGNSEMHVHSVAGKQPNPWGLFDIYGNAWELAYDWRREGKPVDPKLEKNGPVSSNRIVFLGGGYSADAKDAAEPATGPAHIGYSHLGFRVVLVGELKLPPEESGWVQLFNGKDLTGWKTHPNQPGNWRVENGILIGSLLNGNANHLFSERADYQDFHLLAEVQIDQTGNSGIYFRSPFELKFLGGKFPPAFEVAIYNDDGPTSYDKYKTGSIHAVKLYPKVLVKNPDWFLLEVEVRDRHVKVKVNGTTTTDSDLDPDPIRKEPRGHFVLQAVLGTVRFRKIEIKELPPAPAPFVILARDTKAEQRFATLLEAVEGAQPRDTIEVRGNGPFATPPVAITGTALTIRAATGFRPVLHSMPTPDHRGGPFLIRSNADLTLEGLELHHRHEAFVSSSCLLWSEGGALHLANCRFVRGGAGFRTVFSDAPVVESRNCEFLTEPGSDVDTHFWSTLHSGGKFVLSNSVLVAGNSGVLLACDQPHLGECEIRLEHNTILAKRAVSFALDALPAQALSVAAKGNVFDTRLTAAQLWFPPRFVAREKAPSPEEARATLPKMLVWQDQGNLYVPTPTVLTMSVHNDLNEEPVAGKEQLPDWPAKGSLEGQARYQGGNLLGKSSSSALTVATADFRLAKASPGQGAGKDGQDIGVDVDLVGPGAAYEKWKKTKEYEEWRNQTDALMTAAR